MSTSSRQRLHGLDQQRDRLNRAFMSSGVPRPEDTSISLPNFKRHTSTEPKSDRNRHIETNQMGFIPKSANTWSNGNSNKEKSSSLRANSISTDHLKIGKASVSSQSTSQPTSTTKLPSAGQQTQRKLAKGLSASYPELDGLEEARVASTSRSVSPQEETKSVNWLFSTQESTSTAVAQVKTKKRKLSGTLETKTKIENTAKRKSRLRVIEIEEDSDVDTIVDDTDQLSHKSSKHRTNKREMTGSRRERSSSSSSSSPSSSSPSSSSSSSHFTLSGTPSGEYGHKKERNSQGKGKQRAKSSERDKNEHATNGSQSSGRRTNSQTSTFPPSNQSLPSSSRSHAQRRVKTLKNPLNDSTRSHRPLSSSEIRRDVLEDRSDTSKTRLENNKDKASVSILQSHLPDGSNSDSDNVQVSSSPKKAGTSSKGKNKASKEPASGASFPSSTISLKEQSSHNKGSSTSTSTAQPKARARAIPSAKPVANKQAASSLKSAKAPRHACDEADLSEQEPSQAFSTTRKVRPRPRPIPSASLPKKAKSNDSVLAQSAKMHRPNGKEKSEITAAAPSIPISANGTAPQDIDREEEEDEDEDEDEDHKYTGGSTQIWWKNASHGHVDLMPSQEELQDDNDTNSDQNDDDGDLIDDDGDLINGRQCPFCDGVLPETPTPFLISMLEKLCNRDDLEKRNGSSNPNSLSLPLSVTATACKRHREETDVIPNGLRAGYPADNAIDWKGLSKRLTRICYKSMTEIARGKMTSSFLVTAKREWEMRGSRRMANVLNDWGSFDQELPGYYGSKGFEIIMQWLNESLVEDSIITSNRTEPLDVQTFLRRVMVPEVAVRLIQSDRDGISRKAAIKILEASRTYGAAVFGHEGGGGGYDEVEIAKEREDREKEKQLQDKRNATILASSQGSKAEALRRGQKAIAELRLLVSDTSLS